MLDEPMLNLGDGGGNIDTRAMVQQAMVTRATDPIMSIQPYVTPGDFAAQYPTPLSNAEIIAMCTEENLVRLLPQQSTALKAEMWRELNELAFTSGSSYISFADGECPEEYRHDGDNTTITLKNIGAKKSLSISDIMHSNAVAGMSSGGYGVGINQLVGPAPSSQGFPGGGPSTTLGAERVAGLKEKEMRLALQLVISGWDRLMVSGNATSNSLEFDGLENLLSVSSGVYTNSSAPSGTFSAQTYNRFLDAGCAAPTHVLGHPQAVNEMMSGYFTLGFNGSQQVFFTSGDRITPGINYAGFVNTSRGKMEVITDWNFTRNNIGGTTFSSSLFGLRMTHQGTPLVYNVSQIPLGISDLVPGCTAISFMAWAKTALVVKHKCAHSRFSSVFTGTLATQCTQIG